MTAATPAPCPCGAASDWEAERDGKYYISCSVPGCWIGPSAETKAEAIDAWNRVALAVNPAPPCCQPEAKTDE